MHPCVKCACTRSAVTATVRSQPVVSHRVGPSALIAADSNAESHQGARCLVLQHETPRADAAKAASAPPSPRS